MSEVEPIINSPYRKCPYCKKAPLCNVPLDNKKYPMQCKCGKRSWTQRVGHTTFKSEPDCHLNNEKHFNTIRYYKHEKTNLGCNKCGRK